MDDSEVNGIEDEVLSPEDTSNQDLKELLGDLYRRTKKMEERLSQILRESKTSDRNNQSYATSASLSYS